MKEKLETTEDGVRLLTAKEAAKYLRISYARFLKIRKQGYCSLPTYPAPPYIMTGKNKKQLRYRLDEFEDWIKNLPKFQTIEEYRKRFKEAEEEVARGNGPAYTQNIDTQHANMRENCVSDQELLCEKQFVNRDERSNTTYMVVKNGVPVNIDELDDSQKAELKKLMKTLPVIKSCIEAIVANNINIASEFIRMFAETKDMGSLEVIFHFARENAQNLTFGMAMMLNGCIAHLSGSAAREDAIALLEGRSGQIMS